MDGVLMTMYRIIMQGRFYDDKSVTRQHVYASG